MGHPNPELPSTQGCSYAKIVATQNGCHCILWTSGSCWGISAPSHGKGTSQMKWGHAIDCSPVSQTNCLFTGTHNMELWSWGELQWSCLLLPDSFPLAFLPLPSPLRISLSMPHATCHLVLTQHIRPWSADLWLALKLSRLMLANSGTGLVLSLTCFMVCFQ